MTGPVKVDMAIVRRRKRDMVDAQVCQRRSKIASFSGAKLHQ